MSEKTYWDGVVETLTVLHRRDKDTHARVLNELLCEPLHKAAKKSGKLRSSGISSFVHRTGRGINTHHCISNGTHH
jgi:hypothetical protein